MVQRLLPGVKIAGADAADALAVAITHAHHLATRAAATRPEPSKPFRADEEGLRQAQPER